MSDTKYELHITGECKKNLKLCKKRGLPMQELILVMVNTGTHSDLFDKKTSINSAPLSPIL